jgi:predicted  nucleic acid-binding Zn-ribbon protein
MSTAVISRESERASLDNQIRRAKAVLRELRDALEDLEDRRELSAAKKRNAGKPGAPWPQAAKELGLSS